jgi:hypothetical protein
LYYNSENEGCGKSHSADSHKNRGAAGNYQNKHQNTSARFTYIKMGNSNVTKKDMEQ